MSVKGLVFLVDKSIRKIKYAGPVPAVYSQITGLTDVDYEVLKDLGGTFGDDYINLGFFTETDALRVGISPEAIAEAKAGAWELMWNGYEDDRSELIQAQRWRIDRHDDEVRMGRDPSEDITPVLQYLQEIRDLPNRYPDPFQIVWPTVPPLPTN